MNEEKALNYLKAKSKKINDAIENNDMETIEKISKNVDEFCDRIDSSEAQRKIDDLRCNFLLFFP